MRIPRKLKIGARTYTVRIVKGIHYNKKPALGVCELNAKRISLQRGDIDLMMGTLVHEIEEAILFQNCISIPHDKLSVLSEQLYNVLRVNKIIK